MRIVVTTMRDEGPFLLEWLAYHQTIGFDHVLAFSNDCSDGTDAMLDRLDQMGVVTHIPNQRSGKKSVQWKALTQAGRHKLVRTADWILVSDVDEFPCIHAGKGKLDDLFSARPDAQGFAIPWRMFGNNGVVEFKDELTLPQFTRCAPQSMIWPWRAVQYKSLFRNHGQGFSLGVHRPKDANLSSWVDGNGTLLNEMPSGTAVFREGPQYGLVQMNHYALHSAESFIVKVARGKPNHSGDAIDLAYWVDRNLNNDEDTRILRHLEETQMQLSEWLADPVLGPLHQQAVSWRKERFSELMLHSDYFYLFARVLQTGPTRLFTMQHQAQFLRMLLRMRAAESARRKAET